MPRFNRASSLVALWWKGKLSGWNVATIFDANYFARWSKTPRYWSFSSWWACLTRAFISLAHGGLDGFELITRSREPRFSFAITCLNWAVQESSKHKSEGAKRYVKIDHFLRMNHLAWKWMTKINRLFLENWTDIDSVFTYLTWSWLVWSLKGSIRNGTNFVFLFLISHSD